MKIVIENGSLVYDVEKLFSNHYPYLKIELYRKPFNDNYFVVKKELLPPGLHLLQFLKKKGKTVINIDNNITVTELEDQFACIGINLEIFRKSGNVWVETSLTNNWTLQQQNKEGEEISRHFNEQKIFTPDRS